ncbi:MAG: tetratricopeptide repeat protein, partial [Candidatus Binatia bacterium]
EHPAVLLAFGRFAAARAAQLKDEDGAKKLFQQARGLLERSKAKGEDSAVLHSEMGEVCVKLGDWQQAASSYEEALRMRRRRNDWRRSLGYAYARMGKIREAERKYREVLAFSPDDTDAWRGLQEMGKKY